MDSTDWRYQLLGALLTGLVAVITAAVPILVRAAINYLENRLHIDLTEAQVRAIQAAASQAVAWAEEQARKEAKASGTPWPSEQKLAAAKAVAKEVLARGSVDASHPMIDPILEQAIEAHLGRMRARS